MITAGPVYPSAYIAPGLSYPCGGGDPEGSCTSGPRFGPASANAFGTWAWPAAFGYSPAASASAALVNASTPVQLLSVPGYDNRPGPIGTPVAGGPLSNAGWRGSSSYGGRGYCPLRSFPDWSGRPRGLPGYLHDPGAAGAADWKTPALLVGGGLALWGLFAFGKRRGRGGF